MFSDERAALACKQNLRKIADVKHIVNIKGEPDLEPMFFQLSGQTLALPLVVS